MIAFISLLAVQFVLHYTERIIATEIRLGRIVDFDGRRGWRWDWSVGRSLAFKVLRPLKSEMQLFAYSHARRRGKIYAFEEAKLICTSSLIRWWWNCQWPCHFSHGSGWKTISCLASAWGDSHLQLKTWNKPRVGLITICYHPIFEMTADLQVYVGINDTRRRVVRIESLVL